MKANIKNSFLLPALLASLGLIPVSRVLAQTFTTLHSFTASAASFPYTNSGGANPYAGLITNSSGTTLYGTAGQGGSGGSGTVFSVNPNGTGFTSLYNFTGGINGNGPLGQLILSSNTLYGTTVAGGSSDKGTVFKVNTNGTGFTILHSFTGVNEVNPYAGLVLSGNTLYGTTVYGGSANNGTVFAVNTDGTGFTNLHSFTAGSGSFGDITNSDGANPYAGLILSGNTLYGTAESGGSAGRGTLFALNTNGTGFANLHSFLGNPSDGAWPYAGLILSGSTLYGTATGGGSSDNGTVFALNTEGTGFTNLYSFTARTGPYPNTNSDGASPQAGLILSGNTLYGTAGQGGSSGNGTVFAVNTDGSGFTILHSFTAVPPFGPYTNSDGASPNGVLILSGNALYGTAQYGGSANNGTVFSLSFRPQLTITPSGTNVILTWPTNVAGFDYTGYTVQSATTLGSPVWSTNSPAPVVVNGQNTVTNPVTGAQTFYRLVQ